MAQSAARFSQVAQRHSHDLCRFSLLDVLSWWRRQLHVVRAILYVRPPQLLLAEWRNLPGDSCCSFYVVQLRTVFFFQRGWSFSLFSLALLPSCHLLLKSRLLGLTLRFRSCLSLPPGYLDTREAGTCAGSRACFSFSFSSIFLLLLVFTRSFRLPP